MPTLRRAAGEREGVGGDGDRSVHRGGGLGRHVEVALTGSATTLASTCRVSAPLRSCSRPAVWHPRRPL